MVMGVNGQDGHNLARAHANTAIDQPEEAVPKGRRTQGHAPQQAGGIAADQRESSHPIDDGLRARCVLDAKRPRQEPQDTSDSAPPDARHSKEVQGQENPVPLGPGDESLRWARELTQTRLGLCEGVGGVGPLGGDARELLALVAIAVASLRGFVLPLLSTVGDFGELTQHVRSSIPLAAGERGCLGLRGRCAKRRERSAG